MENLSNFFKVMVELGFELGFACFQTVSSSQELR